MALTCTRDIGRDALALRVDTNLLGDGRVLPGAAVLSEALQEAGLRQDQEDTSDSGGDNALPDVDPPPDHVPLPLGGAPAAAWRAFDVEQSVAQLGMKGPVREQEVQGGASAAGADGSSAVPAGRGTQRPQAPLPRARPQERLRTWSSGYVVRRG